MKMKTVDVHTLIGWELDWCVAQATKAWTWMHEFHTTMTLDPTFKGVEVRKVQEGWTSAAANRCMLIPNNPMRQDPQVFAPTIDAWIFVYLAEKHRPWISPPTGDKFVEENTGYPDGWDAEFYVDGIPMQGDPDPIASRGAPTMQVAFFRALVVKLGESNMVEVPDLGEVDAGLVTGKVVH